VDHGSVERVVAPPREPDVRLRVLEVLATLKRAGAERMAVNLARGLDPARFEPAVVSLFDPFPDGFEPALEEAGIRTWHLGKRPGFDPRVFSRLSKVLREFRPAVVHTHSYVLRYSLPAGMAAGAGAMAHTVHNLARKEVDFPGRCLQWLAFRGRVAPVAIAEEVGRSIRECYGVAPAAVIPNGIATEAFHVPEARQPWRAAHGIAEDDFVVASVARLDPQKDPLGLLRAFAEGLGSDPRARLVLAGDGSLRGEAEREAAALGLGARVHFLGVEPWVTEVLAAADVFALFSRYEGNPLAVMEAMAAGLPVVATAVGGVPEIVSKATGVLVPGGDGAGFAAALAGLAADPARRRAMGESARARAQEFHVDRMVAAYSALFERLAGAGK
jgi:glycosyltransferase involved in cell wall biosynthesis